MKMAQPITDENLRTYRDFSFWKEVVRRSDENFRRCMQCLSCAIDCPVAHAMTYRPNGVFRLVQFGYRQETLECSDIWLCMGCNTCSIGCPMAIDIPAVMDTLREMAIEEKVKIAEPAILNFHQEVLNSIQRYGRTHKLEIMLRFKLRQRDLFSDIDLGLKMLAKRKLDLRPSKIADPTRLRSLFLESLASEDTGSL